MSTKLTGMIIAFQTETAVKTGLVLRENLHAVYVRIDSKSELGNLSEAWIPKIDVVDFWPQGGELL